MEDRNTPCVPVSEWLSPFTGDDEDCPYDWWEFQVSCLVHEKRKPTDIKLAIKHSLKGQAARTLRNIGAGASVEEILNKFQTRYGETRTAGSIMSEFYSMRQLDTEDARSFALRLEDCIQKAVKLGRVSTEEKDTLLKEVFRVGLKQEIRIATFYLFREDFDFSTLLSKVRRHERELDLNPEVQTAERKTFSQLQPQIDELSSFIGDFKSVTIFEPSRNYEGLPSSPPYIHALHNGHRRRIITCWRCGQPGHVMIGCRQPLNVLPSVGGVRPAILQGENASSSNRW